MAVSKGMVASIYELSMDLKPGISYESYMKNFMFFFMFFFKTTKKRFQGGIKAAVLSILITFNNLVVVNSISGDWNKNALPPIFFKIFSEPLPQSS